MFGRKKKADIQIDRFEVGCIFPEHNSGAIQPADNNFLYPCEVCALPRIPKVLLDVLTTGKQPNQPLVQSEAATSLFVATVIYWAQYNLEVRRFEVSGRATQEIDSSALEPAKDIAERQSELLNTLDALESVGETEFGALEDYKFLFGFCRDMLIWDVVESNPTGEQFMNLSVLRPFTLLTGNNYASFREFVESVLETFPPVAPLVEFFSKALDGSKISERAYVPVKVEVHANLMSYADSADRKFFEDQKAHNHISLTFRENISAPRDPNLSTANIQIHYKFVTAISNKYVDYEPWLDFEIEGHIIQLEHRLTLTFNALIPATYKSADSITITAANFNSFNLYFFSDFEKMQFDDVPWVHVAERNYLQPNKLTDEAYWSESGKIYDVKIERVNKNSNWFEGSPWSM